MTTIDLPTPKLRSYTALSTYAECPRQYRLKYVDKLREDPAVWNIGGTAFHQCVEWYLTGDYTPAGQFYVEDAWLMAWTMAVDEVMQRHPDASPDLTTWRAANQGREGVEWWNREGPEMVRRFIAWKANQGRDLVVLDDGVEHRFEVELGGVPVVAIPDCLVVDEFGQVNILDWKSGRRAPKGALQLAVYKAAVLAGWDMEPVWGHFYLTRKAVLLPYDLTKWAPEAIGQQFQEFDSRERAGDYRPTPGDHCKFCPATAEHCEFSTKEIQ